MNGTTPETFDYGQLRIRRGKHRLGVPLFDKWYRFGISPSLASALATGGLSEGIVWGLSTLASGHAYFLHCLATNWLEKRWVSLRTDEPHRCARLVLPCKTGLRLAILEELAVRDKKELRVRSSDDITLRAQLPYPCAGNIASDLELPTLGGTLWRPSQLRGTVVLLNS